MSTEGKEEKPPEKPLELGQFGQFLKEHGVGVTALPESTGCETVQVERKDLTQALKLLRNSPEVKLDFLATVSGVEEAATIDSVYHLWSFSNNNEMVVKVRIPKTDFTSDGAVEVPSISTFWPAANWHERETYDLMGVRYFGHPYLRRILNPWDWDGFPLRKDYKQPVDALNDKNPHSMR